MIPHNITQTDYYSHENSMKYMGASQFKDFLKCEDVAVAKLKEEYVPEKTTALLVGSYVDAHFEGTLDMFKSENPELFKRKGKLKAEYIQA